jgi:hypothetical protein
MINITNYLQDTISTRSCREASFHSLQSSHYTKP